MNKQKYVICGYMINRDEIESQYKDCRLTVIFVKNVGNVM